MARRVTAQHEMLRETEHGSSDPEPAEPFKLRVTRPHPSNAVDRRVGEVWGHGTRREMEKLKEDRQPDYGNEYKFHVVEK